ncbi:tetratricopeptide repeat protein [Blastomonas marina]|uniref:tetratricopeptide repeat protein n=1 Tax=Blastomonas marina TaxID=1867408 RepID=UPI002AC94211|nr:tetratricopeptide repeat protein [Blastomonas marina]WPZ03775.1 tetratricopeptide repeat protein [Blastomonas marina]
MAKDRWPIDRALSQRILVMSDTYMLAELTVLLADVDSEIAKCSARHRDLEPCQDLIFYAAALSARTLETPAQIQRRFQRAIVLAERLYGPLSDEFTIELIDHLATHYQSIGRDDLAEPLERLVLERRERIRSPHLIAATGDLGSLLMRRGKYREARALLERSNELALAADPGERLNYVVGLANLAQLEYRAGNFATADRLYEQACPILVRELTGSTAELTCWLDIGILTMEYRTIADARKLFEVALARSTAVLGAKNLWTLNARSMAAKAASIEGDEQRAEALFSDNRAALADAPPTTPASQRGPIYFEEGAHYLRHAKQLARARTLLRRSTEEFLTAMAGFPEYDGEARKVMQKAQPAFLATVAADWRLAKGPGAR